MYEELDAVLPKVRTLFNELLDPRYGILGEITVVAIMLMAEDDPRWKQAMDIHALTPLFDEAVRAGVLRASDGVYEMGAPPMRIAILKIGTERQYKVIHHPEDD